MLEERLNYFSIITIKILFYNNYKIVITYRSSQCNQNIEKIKETRNAFNKNINFLLFVRF